MSYLNKMNEISWKTFSIEKEQNQKKTKSTSRKHWIQYFEVFKNVYADLCPSQVVLMVKNLPANAGDIREACSVPGSGRSPGGGSGNPLQYSCLENPMDRGAWRATGQGLKESDTTEAAHLQAWTHARHAHMKIYRKVNSTGATISSSRIPQWKALVKLCIPWGTGQSF